MQKSTDKAQQRAACTTHQQSPNINGQTLAYIFLSHIVLSCDHYGDRSLAVCRDIASIVALTVMPRGCRRDFNARGDSLSFAAETKPARNIWTQRPSRDENTFVTGDLMTGWTLAPPAAKGWRDGSVVVLTSA